MTSADMELRLAEPPRLGRRIWGAALAVSMLLHLLAVYLLTYDLPWSGGNDEETPVNVSLVPAESLPPEIRQPETKQPEPPPPKVEQKPEDKPQAKPEAKSEPKPETKPAVPARPEPPKAPPPPKAEPAKAPPKPNLHPDKLAEKSSPPSTVPDEKALADAARKKLDPATRSLSDLILGRVSQLWSPPPEMRGHRYQIHFVIDLLPNGMFGPPFAADGPWNPEAALDGLRQIPPGDPRYMALINFYRTLREIQPIPLPASMSGTGQGTGQGIGQATGVRSVPVWFSLDDMP